MPDVIFAGPAGRIEGRIHKSDEPNAPLAVVLHPHPQFGGTMNNRVVYEIYHAFVDRRFSVLRFNFRGVGRSQGTFDHGIGELSDAAAALDWMQSFNANAPFCWVAGFSFGAWIGMQLLMRRPEICGFLSVAPPANMYDFAFLAPCPSAGLILHGRSDQVVPENDVAKLYERLIAQRGLNIRYREVEGANHFFDGHIDDMIKEIEDYLDTRLAELTQA